MLKKTGGFTLIEMLVSMMIVAMISTGLLAINESNTERSKRERFQTNVEAILTFFRSARTSAITNAQVGGETPYAFGVYLELLADNSIDVVLFADDNDDTGTGVYNNQYDAAHDTLLKSQNIPLIWSLALENPSASGDAVTLDNTLTTLFLPPNSEMVINDNDATNDLVSVEISGLYKSLNKRICINRVSQFFEILTGESCS